MKNEYSDYQYMRASEFFLLQIHIRDSRGDSHFTTHFLTIEEYSSGNIRKALGNSQ